MSSVRIYATAEYAYLEGEHVVRKDYNFVSSVFVVLNKELARLELVRVHAIQKHALP